MVSAPDRVAATTPDGLPGEPLVKVTLVPVEVFGADEGYGLMDAVSPWSDCNRARGHIYRRDDIRERHREPGDTITVYVPQSELAKFEKHFGED